MAGNGTLAGQALTDLSVAELATCLSEAGLACQVRESSHYAGGTYLRVGRPDADATFERVSPNEWLVRGDAESVSALLALAEVLSRPLIGAGIRHRIEVYNGAGTQIAYLHQGWPAAPVSP